MPIFSKIYFLRWLVSLSLISVALVHSQQAQSLTVHAGSTVGLMNQPTSAYFHGVYGGYADISSDHETWVLRGSYMERPKFVSGGYIDQEYGAFGQIGTRIGKAKNHGLRCFVGYGRMSGYLIAEEGQETSSEGGSLRNYSLPGPAVTIEYGYFWNTVAITVSNMSFTGIEDEEQLEAKVAWPYNILSVNLEFRF